MSSKDFLEKMKNLGRLFCVAQEWNGSQTKYQIVACQSSSEFRNKREKSLFPSQNYSSLNVLSRIFW